MMYVRFTNEPEKDLERGFSFTGYMLFDSEEKAIGELSNWESDLDGKIDQDNVTGLWGRRLSGLCGFAIDSEEDAQRLIAENENYKRDYAVIYEGESSWDSDFDGGDDEGERFSPSKIVKVIKL